MAKNKLIKINMKTKKENTVKPLAKSAKTIKVPVVTKAYVLQKQINDLESVHNLAEVKTKEIKQLQESKSNLIIELNEKKMSIDSNSKIINARTEQILDLQEWKARAQDVIAKLREDNEKLESQIQTQSITIKDLMKPKPNWFQRLFMVLAISLVFAVSSFAQNPFHNVNKITVENHKQFLPNGFKVFADTAGIKSYQNESGQKIVFIFHNNKLNKVYTYSENLLPTEAWKYPYQYTDTESKVYTSLDYILSETKDRGLTKWAYHNTKFLDNKIPFSKFYQHKGN